MTSAGEAVANPLVSIGVPAFNEEKHLATTLGVLLAQDYRDLEVIVSDNASTDRTWGICQAMAERDPRVRLIRQEENIGPVDNFRAVYEAARGRYFMWTAGDDAVSPHYVSTLLASLAAHDAAVLACPRAIFVDEQGREMSTERQPMPPPTDGGSALQRQALLLGHPASSWVYGLYDRDRLSKEFATLWALHVWGGEIIFLHSLCLRHVLVGDPRAVLYKRVHRESPFRPRTSEEHVRFQSRLGGKLLWQALSSPLPIWTRAKACGHVLIFMRQIMLRRGAVKLGKIWIRGLLEMVRVANPRQR